MACFNLFLFAWAFITNWQMIWPWEVLEKFRQDSLSRKCVPVNKINFRFFLLFSYLMSSHLGIVMGSSLFILSKQEMNRGFYWSHCGNFITAWPLLHKYLYNMYFIHVWELLSSLEKDILDVTFTMCSKIKKKKFGRYIYNDTHWLQSLL